MTNKPLFCLKVGPMHEWKHAVEPTCSIVSCLCSPISTENCAGAVPNGAFTQNSVHFGGNATGHLQLYGVFKYQTSRLLNSRIGIRIKYQQCSNSIQHFVHLNISNLYCCISPLLHYLSQWTSNLCRRCCTRKCTWRKVFLRFSIFKSFQLLPSF